ncbi:HMP-PP phosphatase [Salmonella enterica subsp. enterica]|nr:HMP-PP phosphatase [Salmonella enterica subsp. enterica]
MARLAAFDMDGTLLMPDHHLGRETIATLARLRERDITLTFATGRHVLEMRHILGTLSLDAYLITGNGTRIHSLEGDVLHRQDLDPQVADTVMHHAWDTRASMHVFNDNGWFTGQEIPALLQAHVYSGFRYQVIDIKSIPAHQVTKICFCGDHDDLIRLRIQLNEALEERAHLCFSAVDCLEVLGFWRMAGEYDYLMRVQVADMKRYDDFYKRLVNSVPGLSDVTSSFAMEQIKYTTSLPIE